MNLTISRGLVRLADTGTPCCLVVTGLFLADLRFMLHAPVSGCEVNVESLGGQQIQRRRWRLCALRR